MDTETDKRRRFGQVKILAKVISETGYVLLCTSVMENMDYQYSIEHNYNGHIQFHDCYTREEAGVTFITLVEDELKKSVIRSGSTLGYPKNQ